jgi:hypothetical protein
MFKSILDEEYIFSLSPAKNTPSTMQEAIKNSVNFNNELDAPGGNLSHSLSPLMSNNVINTIACAFDDG